MFIVKGKMDCPWLLEQLRRARAKKNNVLVEKHTLGGRFTFEFVSE
jgi:hypothetical protein